MASLPCDCANGSSGWKAGRKPSSKLDKCSDLAMVGRMQHSSVGSGGDAARLDYRERSLHVSEA